MLKEETSLMNGSKDRKKRCFPKVGFRAQVWDELFSRNRREESEEFHAVCVGFVEAEGVSFQELKPSK